MLAITLAVALGAAAEKPKSEKPKIIVLDLTAGGGVPVEVVQALSETVATRLAARQFFDVVSSRDLATLIGIERQKQLLGCSEESASCLAEITGSLGARFVLSGSVTRLGDSYQLNLQTLDTQKAQPLGRATRFTNDLSSLRQQMDFAIAEATGLPLPEPPSRLLPYALIGSGAAAVVAGGVFGFQTLSEEGALVRELNPENPAAPIREPASFYRGAAARLGRAKTVSLLTVIAGAALIGGGVYLDSQIGKIVGGTSVALVPGGGAVGWSQAW